MNRIVNCAECNSTGNIAHKTTVVCLNLSAGTARLQPLVNGCVLGMSDVTGISFDCLSRNALDLCGPRE